MTIHYFYEQLPEVGTKFKATFADESGFNIFRRGVGEEECLFFGVDNQDLLIIYENWFEEAGYLYWEYVDE